MIDAVDAAEIAGGKRTIPAEWFQWIADDPTAANRLIAEQEASLLRGRSP